MLKGIKKLEIVIAPFHPKAGAVKCLAVRVMQPSIQKTNPECVVKATVDDDVKASPRVNIEWDNGELQKLDGTAFHMGDFEEFFAEAGRKREIDELRNSPVEAMDDQTIFDQAMRMRKLLQMDRDDPVPAAKGAKKA